MYPQNEGEIFYVQKCCCVVVCRLQGCHLQRGVTSFLSLYKVSLRLTLVNAKKWTLTISSSFVVVVVVVKIIRLKIVNF